MEHRRASAFHRHIEDRHDFLAQGQAQFLKEARKAGRQNMTKTAKTSSALVAVVGTGVIGASWAAGFLAKGFDVVATDPAEGAEARLRSLVSDFWPALKRIGLAPGASLARLKFESDLTSTVAGAAFIQENGPERVDIKRDLIARIDAAAPPKTL